MIKKYLMKKMLQKQLKDLPKDQQEMWMTIIEKDPKLFEQIAKEIQVETKKGSTQMSAAMKVLPKHQKRLKELMGEHAPQQSGTQFSPDGKIKR